MTTHGPGTINQTIVVVDDDEHGEPGAFTYQRYAHPKGAAGEDALGEL